MRKQIGVLVLAAALASGAACGDKAKEFKLVSEQTVTNESESGLTFKETLRDGDTVVGHDAGKCTFAGDKADCRITVTLDDGTLRVHGPLVPGAKHQKTPIVGGTGKYDGARGYIRSTTLDDSHFELVFHWTS